MLFRVCVFSLTFLIVKSEFPLLLRMPNEGASRRKLNCKCRELVSSDNDVGELWMQGWLSVLVESGWVFVGLVENRGRSLAERMVRRWIIVVF